MKSSEEWGEIILFSHHGRQQPKDVALTVEAIREEQRKVCAEAYEKADDEKWDAACLDVTKGDEWTEYVRDAILNAGKE